MSRRKTLITSLAVVIIASWASAEDAQWSERTRLPEPLESFGVGSTQEKLYIIGGQVPADLGQTGPLSGRVHEYDPLRNTWSIKANLLAPRARAAVCSIGTKVYAIGGAESSAYYSRSPRVEVYDSLADVWSRKNDMTVRKSAPAAVSVGTKIYVFGSGFDGSGNFEAEVGIYDPERDTWSLGAAMPTPRVAMVTGVIDGRIYAVAGMAYYGSPTTENEVYVPEHDKWLSLPGVNRRVWATAGGAVGGKLFLVSNPKVYAGRDLDLVMNFDPGTNTWNDAATLPVHGEFVAGTACRGRLYIVSSGGTIFEGSLPFTLKPVRVGTLEIRNNVIRQGSTGTAQLLVRGVEGGGTVSFAIYSTSGLPLGRIGEVTLGANGTGILSFNGRLAASSLRHGVYWVVASGAVRDRQALVVARP